MEECVEQAVGEGVNALSLEGRGVSAERGLCSPPSHKSVQSPHGTGRGGGLT